MRKLLTLLLAIALCCFIFSSCNSKESSFNTDRFLYVDTNGETGIYVDKETRVMYMWVKVGYGGGLTVMLDENGNPLLWEGDFQNE